MGTPCEAYKEEGAKVWHYEQSTYGSTKIITGDLNFIPFRYQGQYEDVETGLYYNRFRYYSPEEESYISQDPIGLHGGILNLYSYVHDTNAWADPFGLVHEATPGYHVYGLYENGSDKPYYVGMTNDMDRRATEHRESGRLDRTGNNTEMRPIARDVTYGEARGIEQANIDHHETTKGMKRGEKISKTNRGNKINSYNKESKTRIPVRQEYFENARKNEEKKLKGAHH